MTKKGVQHETTTNIYHGVQNAGDLDLLNGAHTTAELCWQHQLNAQLLSHWKSEFLERASQVFEQDDKHSVEQERIADLEHLIRRLANGTGDRKRSLAVVEFSLEQKWAVIAMLSADYPINGTVRW